MITVDLLGFDTIRERLKTASDSVFAEVDTEIGASMQEMVAGALRDVPRDVGAGGGLASAISFRKVSDLNFEMVCQKTYAAFVEFGTRSQVVIPPGLEEEASRHRGSSGGSSISAKQAIFQWCARHGIEQKFWYPIFAKIMVRGIHPHPFFFKQLEAERPNLLNRLHQIL